VKFDTVGEVRIALKPVGLRWRVGLPNLPRYFPVEPRKERAICAALGWIGTGCAHQKSAETNAPAPEEASLDFARERRIARRNHGVPHVVLNRDHADLNQLFASCMPQLKRTAVRLLPTREDGEDALQDALLLGYRKLDQFKGESQFSTWMHTILVNAARSLLRRRRSQPRTSSIDWNEEGDEAFREPAIADSRSNPEQEYRQREASRIASEYVKKLPSTYQPVVWLCDIRALEMKDVAERLHRPLGTIKSQLHRAHRLIRAEMRHERASRNGRRPRVTAEFPIRGKSPVPAPRVRAQRRLKLRSEPLSKGNGKKEEIFSLVKLPVVSHSLPGPLESQAAD